MKFSKTFFALVLSTSVVFAQKPKLVVGIVVDQMRYEYLQRFAPYFGENGFERLKREGSNFNNHHYDYVPTFTGPGHASIYTGTTPANHGIIANDWYDKTAKTIIYCCTDTSVKTVGSNSGAGQMSSKNLKTNSLGDAFHLGFGKDSKVYGVSLKDRGAILPAGHSADGAFWFDGGKYGNWISSTQYYTQLPKWVSTYNSGSRKDALLNQSWIISPELKSANIQDNQPWERPFKGRKEATFPYDLKKLKTLNDNYSLLKAVPQGNEMSADFAKTLITEEGLGQDDITDLLALSFSATDYVGHYFGTQSLEVADAYVRLDKTIAALLTFLDEKVGKDNYVLFLSADHGAIDPPRFYEANHLPGDVLSEPKLTKQLNKAITAQFALSDVVGACINEQIFINPDTEFSNVSQKTIEDFIINWLKNHPGIDFACRYADIDTQMGMYQAESIKKGYYPNLSGEIVFALKPGWADYGPQGSTHGTNFTYDTHVPFILFGSGIPAQQIYERSAPADIAPTISHLVGTVLPWGATGKSFMDLLK
jgi:predicted AlkP superfamily pyrophosphatase or phosphodiesterase